jgi:transcriptional regulator with XRE-family HTH domain
MDDPRHRLRARTNPLAQPPRSSPEGLRARWWREHVMGMSRPQLAEALGIDDQRIYRYESARVVPPLYRLACAAYVMRPDSIGFDWLPDEPESGRRRK